MALIGELLQRMSVRTISKSMLVFLFFFSSIGFAGEYVGEKYCQTFLGFAHSHQWTATGHKKVTAMADAVAGWTSYTSFEYGAHWADFDHAVSKSVKCTQDNSTWSCTAQARPCRK